MPGLMINKSTEVLFEGKYNHGNDIKELALATATLPVSSTFSKSQERNGVGGGSGLVGSCSSISGSTLTSDAVNFHGSSSSSGQSSTTNILHSNNSSSCDKLSPWNKMQQRCTWRYAVDLLVLLAFAVLFALIESNVIPVFKRGFWCDDRTISYKFTGDTVSIYTLLTIVIPVPIFLFWILEFVACEEIQSKTPVWKLTLFRGLRIYRDYILGQILCLAVVCVAKTAYGGLRPHFLDSCKPDKLATCTAGEFVTEYTCTNLQISKFNLLDSRKSFPSGHSSMSVFQAIFTAWYLQIRFSRYTTSTTVLFFQFLAICWGVFCPISRITDYRHHWWDALTGSVLGVIFAALTCKIVSRDFKYLEDRSSSPVHMNGNGVLNYESNNRLLNRAENNSSRSDV